MKKTNLPHFYVLSALAGLTILFLGAAAVSLWGGTETGKEKRFLKSRPSQGRNLPATIEFTVEQTGIVGVSAANLRQLNLKFGTFSVDSLNLTRSGTQVPIYVDAQEEMLYFYASPVKDDLEATAVYRITAEPGRQMVLRDAAPTAAGDVNGIYHYRWEEHSPILARSDGSDVWLGQLLLAPRTWQLTLDSIRSGGGPAELQIDFWSNTEDTVDPDHHIDVLLNNKPLADWYWDGIRQERLNVSIPDGLLEPGEFNLLTISAPGDTGAVGESIYINSIEVNYEREIQLWREQLLFTSSSENVQISLAENPPLVFDITDPDNPSLLQNYRYVNEKVHFSGSDEARQYIALEPWQAIQPVLRVVPQWKLSLRATNRGADYIAIVADEDGFLEALQSLLIYRREQDLRVTAVPLAQIYDEFGNGEQSPAAIRDFLMYTAANWAAPAPRFVLFVGDASYDIRNTTNGKNRNLLPTTLYSSTDAHYLVSDTWLVDFNQTNIPQMASGRFPAETTVQLHEMVAKTIAFEANASADWQQRALFIADSDNEFDAFSHRLNNHLNDSGLSVHQLDVTLDESAHYEILSAFSNGAGIINYAGYGREQYWGDATIFHARDAAMLTNSGRFPILTTFTCNNGAFGDPNIDSLAESLLWVADGGIVAAVAPSGRTEVGAQLQLGDAFYAQLFSAQAPTLGEALQQAKTAVSANPAMQDAIHTFNLLGDPALQLKRP